MSADICTYMSRARSLAAREVGCPLDHCACNTHDVDNEDHECPPPGGYEEEQEYDPEFAYPGSNSALRAGPRIHPCPTCKEPNRLSPKDVQLGYQCDACADKIEAGGY